MTLHQYGAAIAVLWCACSNLAIEVYQEENALLLLI